MKPVFKPEAQMEHSLAHAILLLTAELTALREQRTNEQQLSLCRLEKKVDLIMANQAELAADLKLVLAQQKKTAAEIAEVQAAQTVAIAKIAELEALITAGGTVTQELIDAVAEVKAQAQVVDDLIPDAVPLPS